MRLLMLCAAAALSTTAGAQTSQWTAYDQADLELNNAYKDLLSGLPAGERIGLRNSERTWIAARDRACGRNARNACALRMTSQRADYLDRQWTLRIAPKPGQCFSTSVKEVGNRLEGDADDTSGASIVYADGHYQVDYDSSRRKLGFKVGDSVRLCVVALPKGCPRGDHRGITYKATDLITRRTWVAADSEHMCGGA